MNQPLHYPPSSSSSTQQQQHPFSLQNNHNHHEQDFKPSSLDSKTSFRYKTYQTAFGPLSLNKFLRKEWIKYYVLLVLLLIGIGVVAIYHHQIVIALHPFVQSMRNLKVNGVEVGWLIPVGVLFIISFPPLFGHEIVIILCGLVWGLWLGFAIVSLGTLLGELANYWTFKYLCSHRAAKLEKKDVNYACMCVVIREGGFWIAFLARLSAIPGHLVTPVFATTGMSLTIFTAATVISMPKQLAGVYLGTLFTDSSSSSNNNNNEDEGSGTGGSGEGGGGSTAVKYSVLAVSFLVTIVAALYIYKKMALARTRLFPDDQLPIVNRPSAVNPPPLASSVGATTGGVRTNDPAVGSDTRTYQHAPSPQRMPTSSSYESSASSSADLRADGPMAISPTLSSDDPSNPFTSHHHHHFPTSFPSSPQDEVEEEDLHSSAAWTPIPLANPHQLHNHMRNPSDNRNPFVDPPYIPIISSPPLPLPSPSSETHPPEYSSHPPDSIPYSIPHRNRNF